MNNALVTLTAWRDNNYLYASILLKKIQQGVGGMQWTFSMFEINSYHPLAEEFERRIKTSEAIRTEDLIEWLNTIQIIEGVMHGFSETNDRSISIETIDGDKYEIHSEDAHFLSFVAQEMKEWIVPNERV